LTKFLHNKKLLILAGVLIVFGSVNYTTNVLAQTSLPENVECQILEDGSTIGECPASELSLGDRILLKFIEQGLLGIAPIIVGLVTIGLNYAKKRGLQISGDAEEYIVNSVRSFVDNQARFLYNNIKENYPDYYKQGKIPENLGKEALNEVEKHLKIELDSDEFTSTTRKMLLDNMNPLIERFVTESKTEQSKRARTLLQTLAPIAVNAVLLSYKDSDEAKKNKEQAIESARKKILKYFESEFLLVSEDLVDMFVGAELQKKTEEEHS